MKIPTLPFVCVAILCCVFSAGANAQTQAIAISLSSYAFTPAAIMLKAGTSYRLHLSNDAGKEHSFSAPKFFAAATVAPDDKAKIVDGAVDLDPGQAIDITVTPLQAGSYTLTCTHFMHAMLGMKGQITVQ